jgi:hypothetical protein
MMGERRVGQEALFYEFSLERHVPDRHLLPSIGSGGSRPNFEHIANTPRRMKKSEVPEIRGSISQ